jgi:DNA-binding transcriptional ArsR family regulator
MPSGLGAWLSSVYPMTARHGHSATDASSTDHVTDHRARSAATSGGDDPPEVAVEDLLELLGDEYACAILRALEDGPKAARDLLERTDMSRPTVYRRLDRLTDAGIVDSRMALARDGHHRQEFHLVVDAVEFQVGTDGIDGRVRAADPAGD